MTLHVRSEEPIPGRYFKRTCVNCQSSFTWRRDVKTLSSLCRALTLLSYQFHLYSAPTLVHDVCHLPNDHVPRHPRTPYSSNVPPTAMRRSSCLPLVYGMNWKIMTMAHASSTTSHIARKAGATSCQHVSAYQDTALDDWRGLSSRPMSMRCRKFIQRSLLVDSPDVCFMMGRCPI